MNTCTSTNTKGVIGLRGRLIDLSFGINRKQRVTLELEGDFRAKFDKLKGHDVRVEIKRWRERRSLNANAYFHVLVGKIAENQGLGNDEVKKKFVVEYGTLATDGDGEAVVFKLPDTVNVDKFYPYTEHFDTRTEGGKTFHYYLVYQRSSELNTKEMARLIDGVVYEAQNLGIETLPPAELARLKSQREDG